MNSIFYELLNLKKASKFKKYFNQFCYLACFETLFSRVITTAISPLVYKTRYEVSGTQFLSKQVKKGMFSWKYKEV